MDGESLRGRTKLIGHALAWERILMPPDCRECQEPSYYVNRSPGHGLCQCGEVGDHQPSKAGRRRWHDRHKEEVRIDVINTFMNSSY